MFNTVQNSLSCNDRLCILGCCSARVWVLDESKCLQCSAEVPNQSVSSVLFGHTARVWDCCIFDHVRSGNTLCITPEYKSFELFTPLGIFRV